MCKVALQLLRLIIYKWLILLILCLFNLWLYKIRLHYGNHIIEHLFVRVILLLMMDYLWIL
jgi:hypothetical protein